MNWIGNKKVFALILVVFALQAVYIALTSSYPMAFDEAYHFTIIEFYSHHLSPIVSYQPPEMASVGDVTRFTSYLSHYILSYPLRLTTLFTDNHVAQVIVLRAINVATVIGALILFRRFLIKLTQSPVATNLATLVYCLLPVSSYLAAHVNYDNILMLCFSASAVVSQNVIAKIRSHERLEVKYLLSLVTLLVSGCLIKFTFVPIAALLILVIAAMIICTKSSYPELAVNRKRLLNLSSVAVLSVTVLVSGLALERYGGNMMMYGTPLPDCASVQSLDTCMQYNPWARNYALLLNAPTNELFEGRSLPGYILHLWIPQMLKGLGMVGVGAATIDPTSEVENILEAMAIIIGIGLIISAVRYRRNPTALTLFAGITVYVIALIYRNYTEFMHLQMPVAIQGRYALFLLIPLFTLGIQSLMNNVRFVYASRFSLNALIISILVFNPIFVYRATSTPTEIARVYTGKPRA